MVTRPRAVTAGAPRWVCNHIDPIVTAPTRNKKGLAMGTPTKHGVDRHIKRRKK